MYALLKCTGSPRHITFHIHCFEQYQVFFWELLTENNITLELQRVWGSPCFFLGLCGIRAWAVLGSKLLSSSQALLPQQGLRNILSPAWPMCYSEHTELFHSTIKCSCLWCLHSSADKGLPVMATLAGIYKNISLLPGWIYKAGSCSTQAIRHWVFCHVTG